MTIGQDEIRLMLQNFVSYDHHRSVYGSRHNLTSWGTWDGDRPTKVEVCISVVSPTLNAGYI